MFVFVSGGGRKILTGDLGVWSLSWLRECLRELSPYVLLGCCWLSFRLSVRDGGCIISGYLPPAGFETRARLAEALEWEPSGSCLAMGALEAWYYVEPADVADSRVAGWAVV
jgi:hypothetical protein